MKQEKVLETGIENFDWDLYESEGNVPIKKLRKKRLGRETYLYHNVEYGLKNLKLYDKGLANVFGSKDAQSTSTVTNIRTATNQSENTIIVDTANYNSYMIDMDKEKEFLGYMGIEKPETFIKLVEQDNSFIDELVKYEIALGFVGERPSLEAGRKDLIRDSLLKSIDTESVAFVADILSSNRGGFKVDINGVEAFLPGSLATANKVRDYQSLIGTKTEVMVEKYDDRQGFIVSHKKYLDTIMPAMLEKIEIGDVFDGIVTGTKPFGIFVEFKEIFTGLIHASKIGISPDLQAKFKNHEIKEGDIIPIEIVDITKKDRIILIPHVEKTKE